MSLKSYKTLERKLRETLYHPLDENHLLVASTVTQMEKTGKQSKPKQTDTWTDLMLNGWTELGQMAATE